MMEGTSPFYWWIVNPGTNLLLSFIFSFLSFVGTICFIANIVFLSISERNRGRYVIGAIFSLIVIGCCLKWEWFLVSIGNLASMLASGIGNIINQAIYYWYLYSFGEKMNESLFFGPLIHRL
ncbi:MAG: hypothetical protein QXK94_00675 [Candidatus Jordarchaeales archaeon]